MTNGAKSHWSYMAGMFFLYLSLPFVFLMPEHFPATFLGVSFTRKEYMAVTLGIIAISMVFMPPYLYYAVKDIRERKARRGIL